MGRVAKVVKGGAGERVESGGTSSIDRFLRRAGFLLRWFLCVVLDRRLIGIKLVVSSRDVKRSKVTAGIAAGEAVTQLGEQDQLWGGNGCLIFVCVWS
jgi:hypothetical protein